MPNDECPAQNCFVRSEAQQRRHGHKLKEGEDADTWARILTKQFRQHIHGDRKPGFSGRLSYPKTGWR
jgi:hypothetical protein